MIWKQFVGGFVVGGLIIGALVWIWAIQVNQAESARALEGETRAQSMAAKATEDANKLTTLQKENDSLLAKLSLIEQRVAQLQAETNRQPAVAATPTETTPETKEPDKLGAIFTYGEYKDVLEGIDWSTVGDTTAKMMPMLAKVLDAVAKGEEIPEEAGEIQKLNGELVTMALRVKNAGVPGLGINSSFTHPSVAANHLYATLEKGGNPMSQEQREALSAFAKRYSDEDAEQRMNYGENTFELEKVIQEASLRGRFYDEAGQLLTTEQRNLLYTDSTKDRLSADIWSTGIVWSQFARPTPVQSRAEFEQVVSEDLGKKLKLEGSDQAQLSNLVKNWSSGMSDEFLKGGTDKYSMNGFPKTQRVRESAQRQLELYQQLIGGLNLSKEQKNTLLKNAGIWVPLYKGN